MTGSFSSDQIGDLLLSTVDPRLTSDVVRHPLVLNADIRTKYLNLVQFTSEHFLMMGQMVDA